MNEPKPLSLAELEEIEGLMGAVLVRGTRTRDSADRLTATIRQLWTERDAANRVLDELRTIEGKRKWYHAGIVWTGELGAFSIHKFLELFLAAMDATAPELDQRHRSRIAMELKPGWLQRQFNATAIDVATWPDSMQQSGWDDDLTPKQRKEAARRLRARADALEAPLTEQEGK